MSLCVLCTFHWDIPKYQSMDALNLSSCLLPLYGSRAPWFLCTAFSSLFHLFFLFWPFCFFTGAFTLSSLHSWLAYLNIFTPFSILATSSRQYWLNKLAHFTLCVVFHGVVGIDANNWNTWQLAGVGRAPERCRSTAVTAPVERPSHDDDDFISSSFVVKVVECPWVRLLLASAEWWDYKFHHDRDHLLWFIDIPPLMPHVEMEIKWNFIDFLAQLLCLSSNVSLLFFLLFVLCYHTWSSYDDGKKAGTS